MYRHNLGIERTCSWADPNPNPVPVNELPAIVHSARSNTVGAARDGLGFKGGAGAIQQVVSAQPSVVSDGGRIGGAGEEGRWGSSGVEGGKNREMPAAAAAAAETHSRLLAEHRKHPCLRRSAVPVVSAL